MLNLRKIRLLDIGPHEDISLALSPGVNAVVGQNGSGKSRLLWALGLGLFGAKPTRTLPEMIRRGKKSGLVEVEFVSPLDGRDFIAIRRLGAGSFWKVIDPKEGLVEAEGTEDVGLFLAQHLSLGRLSPEAAWDDVLFFRQEAFKAPFLERRPAVRRALLEEVLGIEEYGQHHKNLRPAVRFFDQEIDRLEAKIAELERSLDRDRSEAKFKRETLEEDMRARTGMIETAESQVEALRVELAAGEAEDNRIREIEAQIAALAAEKRAADKDLKMAEAGRIEAERLRAERARLEEIVEAGAELPEQFEALQEKVNQLKIMAAQRSATLKAEIENHRKRLSSLGDEGDGLCPVCGQPLEAEKRLELVNLALTGEKEAMDLLRSPDTDLTEARRALAELKQDFDSYQRARQQLAARRDAPAPDISEAEIGQKRDELAKIEARLRSLEKEKAGLDHYRTRVAREKLRDLELELSRLATLQKKDEEAISNLEDRLAELEALAGEKEGWEKTLAKAKSGRGRLIAIREAIKGLGPAMAGQVRSGVSVLASRILSQATGRGCRFEWGETYEVSLAMDGGPPKLFWELSGGEGTLAAIAMRLAMCRYFTPSLGLAVMDEPTLSLDVENRGLVAEAISNLNLGGQIIVVSHDDSLAHLVANTHVLGVE